jgi:oxygen-independent coproporphyrinogen-3 oxidase
LDNKDFFLVKLIEIFGLYIHWPFCLSKCPYCDFNSHVRTDIDEEAWTDAFLRELNALAPQMNPDRFRLGSIFFGGGTPSLMPPTLVSALIREAKSLWSSEPNLEISLEANPNTFDQGRFVALRHAGINRLSLGIQSLQAEELQFLKRTHSARQAQQAMQCAQTLFPRYSFDLIYGLPQQRLETWQDTLSETLAFQPTHLSCYQLTFEPGTPFYQRFQKGELAYPPDEDALLFFHTTRRLLRRSGLIQYETSNYAKDDHQCAHNLIYWRSQAYLGIGPGAAGRWQQQDGRLAQANERIPEVWLRSVQEKGNGIQKLSPLSADEIFREWLMMGLRLKEGINLNTIRHLTGRPWQDWGLEDKIAQLQEAGLCTLKAEAPNLPLPADIHRHPSAQGAGRQPPKHKKRAVPKDDPHLRLTLKGHMRLNSVLSLLYL